MDRVVDELNQKNLLVEDQGAMVVRLAEDVPPVLIKRSDGANPLYNKRSCSIII